MDYNTIKMSLSPRSNMRMTNIEKKVLSAILTPHQNDLRVKDGDSLDSSCNSEPSLSRELSPHFSVIQYMGKFWAAIREGESLSSSSGSFDLQQLLLSASEGQIVELPGERITVDSLFISTSITLQGSSSTILETGSIFVSNASGSRVKVLFNELNIVYKPGLTSPHTLFAIEGSDLNVEARDCTFRSEGNTEDSCFLIKGNSQTEFSPMLILKSCQIIEFFEAVHAGHNSRILIEKSYIEKTRGNGVFLLNPREFHLNSSFIRKCARSGVEIRVQKPQDVSTVRNIVMHSNEFRSNNGYGMHIWSDHHCACALRVEIRGNSILHNKKEGIAVKHLVLNELLIEGNDAKGNTRTGCWIQKVSKNEGTIGIVNNKFYDSSAGYGLYVYSSSIGINKLECFENRLGGIAIAGTGESFVVSVNDSVVRNNSDNGVTILQTSNASIIFKSVKITGNEENGVYCYFKDNETLGSEVKLQTCQISDNKAFGVTGFQMPLTITDCGLMRNKSGNFNVDALTIRKGRLMVKHTNTGTKKHICKENCLLF